MRRFLILLGAIWMLGFLPRHVAAQTTAALAFGDGAHGGQWELVAVRVQAPVGGGTVLLQDARGGMTVARSLDDAVTEPGTGESRILLPLPLLDPADLPAGAWPLEVSVRSASGAATRERVTAALGEAAVGGQNSFRVLAASGEAGGNLAWGKLSDRPAVFATAGGVGEQEILSGPALLFAGCDAVLVPNAVARELSAERIAALLNAGVRLAVARDPAGLGEGGVLGRLAWVHVGGGGAGEFWITAASDYARPRVVEEGLARARTLQVRAPVEGGTRAAVLLAPVAGLAVLLLARGLFQRRGWVLLALAAGLAGASAGAIAVVRTSAKPGTEHIAWWNREGGSPGTSLRITEDFTASSSLFGRRLRVEADAESLVFPISASARGYFGLRAAVLSLDELSEDGLQRVSRLEMTLEPRDCAVYVKRSAALLAGGADLTQGHWIDGGYVLPAGVKEQSDAAAGMIVAEWARGHPEARDAILTWYELRFAGDHRYFMREATVDAPLEFVDFGNGAAATAP